MISCTQCQGKGLIPNQSPFGLPSGCLECSGTGETPFRNLQPGQHLCLLYSDRKKQLNNAVEYLLEGLLQNQLCLYLADEHSSDDIAGALSLAGVDVAESARKSALQILAARQTYLRDDRHGIDSPRMIHLFEETAAEAVEEGFSALRVAGEMTWTLDAVTSARIAEYESSVDKYFLEKNPPIIGLCQYNTDRFPFHTLQEVSKVHRTNVEVKSS